MTFMNKILAVLATTLFGIIVAVFASLCMGMVPIPPVGLYTGTALGMIYGFYIMQYKNPIDKNMGIGARYHANKLYTDILVKTIGGALVIILVLGAVAI